MAPSKGQATILATSLGALLVDTKIITFSKLLPFSHRGDVDRHVNTKRGFCYSKLGISRVFLL